MNMSSYQYVYVMKGLTKHINGKQILKETFLSFLPGAKIGMIGHNGAGKSTLLRIMAGIDKEYDGEAWAADGVKVGYLAQEPKLDESKNVYENIMDSLAYKKGLLDEFNEISAKFAEEMSDDEMNDLLAKQADLQEKIDAVDAWSLEREIEVAMDALRCPDKNADVTKISGGEKRRVALCKLLLEKPDMLLLDEPTNHLDAESVSWLENFLKQYKGTVVVITHDRYFLDNVTDWILEIERGNCIPWHSNYSAWLEQKHEKMVKEEKEESGRQKELAKELEWIRQSPKARRHGRADRGGTSRRGSCRAGRRSRQCGNAARPCGRGKTDSIRRNLLPRTTPQWAIPGAPGCAFRATRKCGRLARAARCGGPAIPRAPGGSRAGSRGRRR